MNGAACIEVRDLQLDPGDTSGTKSFWSLNCTCYTRDLGLTPGSRRSPREGNGNPPQYSCLENSMDRGAWQATIHGVMKSQTWLSNCHFLFRYIYDQTHGWRWRKRLCSSSVPSPSFSPLLLPSTYVSLFSSGLTAFPMNLLCSIEDLACRFTFSLQIVLTTSPGFGRDQ